MGHVRMMAAVQPFISGAISKTVNMPESATVEEIEEIYFKAWKMGIKALAIYRDNCKVGQPLSDAKAKKQAPAAAETAADRLGTGPGHCASGCPASATRRPRRSPSAARTGTSPRAPTRVTASARSSSSSASRVRRWPA